MPGGRPTSGIEQMFALGRVCALHTHPAAFLRKSQACGFHTLMKKTSRVRRKNIIGARVRQARLRRNPSVSQDDLAGKLAAQGILLDRSAISRIESQGRYLMDYEIAAIARALKVSVAWLFGENS